MFISGATPGNYKDLDTQVNSNSNIRIVDGALVLKNIQKVIRGEWMNWKMNEGMEH